jgi:hypothetical protein
MDVDKNKGIRREKGGKKIVMGESERYLLQ